MDKEILDKYKKAGKIAAECRDFGVGLVKNGANIFEIAEKIEEKIVLLGGKPACPVNISLNENAAHYTPVLNDTIVVKAEDYVKVDVTAHVDGYVGDTALTVRPAGKDELIKCSEKMLEEAIKVMIPGTLIGDIGGVVEKVAESFGFKPIRNLCGHGLDRYNLHAGLTIPNIQTDQTRPLEEGDVFAVEPFCTTGAGMIKDCEPALIFRWISDRPVRMAEARKITEMGKTKFDKLPFAKRWLQKDFSGLKLDMALRQLIGSGSIYPYKILREVSGAPVAQTEHTIIVGEKPIILTKV